jgi:hypothetical protein
MKTQYKVVCSYYTAEFIQVDDATNKIGIVARNMKLKHVQTGHDCLLVAMAARASGFGENFEGVEVKVIDLITLEDINYRNATFTIEMVRTELDRLKPGFTARTDDGREISTDGLSAYKIKRIAEERVQVELPNGATHHLTVPEAAFTLEVRY